MMGGAASFFHHGNGGGGGPAAVKVAAVGPKIGSYVGGALRHQTYNGPPLYVHAAYFAEADVMHQVRRLIMPRQSPCTEGSKLKGTLGDTWS